MQTLDDAPRPDDDSGLLRALGRPEAIAIVVGNVIGSGIFLKPGGVAEQLHDFRLILLVWVVGGVLCVLGALTLAELAAMLPRAGGLYVYLREAYGRPVGFLFGWTEFLIRVRGSIAALSVAFVSKFAKALDWQVSDGMQVLLVAILVGGLAWVNVMGVLWGGRLQLTTTIIKAVSLLLVGLAPLLLFTIADSAPSTANYATTVAPSQTSLAAQIGVVLLAVMWAYNGWHGITPLAEEIKDPKRNFPRALFGGIAILIVLYLAANFAYHSVLSMEEMEFAKDDAPEHMLNKLIGPVGATIMAVIIMCSVFGAIATNLLNSPRISFAMGRDRVFFRSLGSVHQRFRTPVVAIIVTAVMAIGLVAAVAIGKHAVRDVNLDTISWELGRRITESLQGKGMFNLLTNFVIFAASIFYLLAVLAVIVLRIRRPKAERPYKTLGYPFVPLAFIVAYVWFLTQVYLSNPLESIMGLGLIAIGIPAYFVFARIRKQNVNEEQTQ
ncbi:MAG: amino acid permease [Planctomycetes bacterium]|nr:amino acid permease [Planctomycetota bacterium]